MVYDKIPLLYARNAMLRSNIIEYFDCLVVNFTRDSIELRTRSSDGEEAMAWIKKSFFGSKDLKKLRIWSNFRINAQKNRGKYIFSYEFRPL